MAAGASSRLSRRRAARRLGAIAAGDIGDHFPPSDPRWKGAPSSLFLEHARDLVTAAVAGGDGQAGLAGMAGLGVYNYSRLPVDAVVVDKHGDPVRDLSASDFSVRRAAGGITRR